MVDGQGVAFSIHAGEASFSVRAFRVLRPKLCQHRFPCVICFHLWRRCRNRRILILLPPQHLIILRRALPDFRVRRLPARIEREAGVLHRRACRLRHDMLFGIEIEDFGAASVSCRLRHLLLLDVEWGHAFVIVERSDKSAVRQLGQLNPVFARRNRARFVHQPIEAV